MRLMPDQHREVIDRFTGPYAFLSNFHPCRVTFYGMTFPSVEAAFQAAKCADHRDRAQFLAMTPEQANRRGRQIRMRDDWDARKRTIMHNLLVHKFSENPDLRSPNCLPPAARSWWRATPGTITIGAAAPVPAVGADAAGTIWDACSWSCAQITWRAIRRMVEHELLPHHGADPPHCGVV